MKMYQLPVWSEPALDSIGLHYRKLQDIEIYVEDLGSEAFYTKLFSRVVNDEVRIKKIIPLGGRSKVVNKCKEYSEEFPALFVIDGDLDLLLGEREAPHNGLFQHRLYCIENYLFCEDASAELLQDSLGNILKEDAYAQLEWLDFKRQLERDLLELFKIYAVSWKVLPNITTVSNSYHELCKKISNRRGSVPCENKVSDLILEIKNQIIEAIGEDGFDEIYSKVSESIEGLGDPLYAVSGKDYLLKALRDYLGYKGANYPHNDGFKFKLARYCNLEPLSELGDAIRKIVDEGGYIQEIS
ncbi:DUF4435 domain-containing protein [Marinomonas pollencensis]|uniref:Uncharacterized protein DUF4435 n=1 Tax=Marinomonas pollencensis TaxID=491954 RepID=A0A3E0DLG4_9GAMM|nr:DUF4435 domain-containing protein [Marinomonas pollencensis]REG83638.1 uncharacterized protein DUF4435 [Marinomonas pollencensis]